MEILFGEESQRVGSRPSEKRYQLAAQKRNQTAQRYDYYNQTADYFTRECRKAQKFHSWNTENLTKNYWDKLKKTESLSRRRKDLEELLKTEESIYAVELNNLKPRKTEKPEVTLNVLREKLREKRTENSLYHPRTFRRIQSYFTYPTRPEREVLKELNTSGNQKLKRMSLENTNLRCDIDSSENHHCNEKNKIVMDFTNLAEQEAHHARDQEYRNNRSAAQKSNFGSYTLTDNYEAKEAVPAANVNSNIRESFLNDQINSSSHANQFEYEASGEWNVPRKFEMRYAQKSLQNTNVCGTAGKRIAEVNGDGTDNGNAGEIEIVEDLEALTVEETEDETVNGGEEGKGAPKSVSQDDLLVYLTQKELQGKIEDLERREAAACNRQSWEDALRLKDMRNRVELVKDKTFYAREDMDLDPELKKDALESIELRSKMLDNREKFCINQQMYSEEAKKIWNNWADEDRKATIKHEKSEREILLRQLEKEWEVLGEKERQRMYANYEKMMKRSFLQHEMDLLDKLAKQ